MSDFQLSQQMQDALAHANEHRGKGMNLEAAFPWTRASREAAFLLAEGRKKKEICAKVSIEYRTLKQWMNHPAFKTYMRQCTRRIESELARTSIANRTRRLKELQKRHNKLNRVIAARAEKYKDVDGGGDTGLLVKDIKVVGRERIEQFTVDHGLLREMREIEKQAAIEAGQWNENLAPLGEDMEKSYADNFSGEDRRTLVIAIFAELGFKIDPASLQGPAHPGGCALPLPGANPS